MSLSSRPSNSGKWTCANAYGNTVIVTEPEAPSSVVATTVTLGDFVDTAVKVTAVVAGLATAREPLLIVMVLGSDEVHVTLRCDETSAPNVSCKVAVAVVEFVPNTLSAVAPGRGVTVCTWPITVIVANPLALLFVLVAVIVADPAAVPVAVTRPLAST